MTLRVKLLGNREYGKVYKQALMTVLKAQDSNAKKIEVEVCDMERNLELESILFECISNGARSDEGYVFKVTEGTFQRVRELLLKGKGTDAIQERGAETEIL